MTKEYFSKVKATDLPFGDRLLSKNCFRTSLPCKIIIKFKPFIPVGVI